MNISGVKKILDRANRLAKNSKSIKGGGASWSYVFPNGVKTKYVLNEVKTHEELEDEILSVFIWLWSLKDYFKEVISYRGGDPKTVEAKINYDKNIMLSADIANGIKHGVIKNSRSTLFPKLGKLSYTVPQGSMKQITVRGNEIEMDFKEFENIEIKMPITDKDDNYIVDALYLIEYVLNEWEGMYATL